MPIRADSGGNERELSVPAKLREDVLADIFIRKRDKAADKGLLQLVQHDLLIVQLQLSFIRIDVSLLVVAIISRIGVCIHKYRLQYTIIQ